MTPKNNMPRIPVLQPYGIIGNDPYASSANSSDPYPVFAADNPFYLDPSFLDLLRSTGTSSADGIRDFFGVKDDSDDIDDSTPATLDDALRNMKETLRKTNEIVRKIKADYAKLRAVVSKRDSSNSDTDPKIKTKIDRIIFRAERFSKIPKSKVPVQTESLSRASPNWNPLHEENENIDFHTDHENDGALQEVAKESKGLSDETIASFCLSKFKGSFSSRSKKPSNDCALCLSAIRKGEYIITLPCKHYFHEECITRWLKMNTVCCMCRYEVAES